MRSFSGTGSHIGTVFGSMKLKMREFRLNHRIVMVSGRHADERDIGVRLLYFSSVPFRHHNRNIAVILGMKKKEWTAEAIGLGNGRVSGEKFTKARNGAVELRKAG